MACPRKGHPHSHNTLQFDCVERPPVLWRFPTFSRGWSCFALSLTVYCSRVPCKDSLHDLLARALLTSFRSNRSSVSRLQPNPSALLTRDRSPHPRVFLLDRFSLLYIAVSIPLIAYCSLVHSVVFGDKYEFLPLMFTSSYSAIGVIGSWLGFSVVYMDS